MDPGPESSRERFRGCGGGGPRLPTSLSRFGPGAVTTLGHQVGELALGDQRDKVIGTKHPHADVSDIAGLGFRRAAWKIDSAASGELPGPIVLAVT